MMQLNWRNGLKWVVLSGGWKPLSIRRDCVRCRETGSASGASTVACCNACVNVSRFAGSMRGRNERMPEFRWLRPGGPIS